MSDYRHDTFLVGCDHFDCLEWRHPFPKAPLRADGLALKHAKRKPGHRTTVYNLSRLEVHTTHYYEPQPMLGDVAPF